LFVGLGCHLVQGSSTLVQEGVLPERGSAESWPQGLFGRAIGKRGGLRNCERKKGCLADEWRRVAGQHREKKPLLLKKRGVSFARTLPHWKGLVKSQGGGSSKEHNLLLGWFYVGEKLGKPGARGSGGVEPRKVSAQGPFIWGVTRSFIGKKIGREGRL